MRVEPLTDGRVRCRFSTFEMDEAREIAHGRAVHSREGKKGYRTGFEGFETHLQGVYAEIAVREYYGGDMELVYGGSDSGADVEALGWRIQVKATPYFREGIKLFNMPDESMDADLWFLVAVDVPNRSESLNGWKPYAELVGFASRRRIEAQQWREHRAGEGTVRCRWLPEEDLAWPHVLFDHPKKPPPPVAEATRNLRDASLRPFPETVPSEADDGLPMEAIYPDYWLLKWRDLRFDN